MNKVTVIGMVWGDQNHPPGRPQLRAIGAEPGVPKPCFSPRKTGTLFLP